LAGAEMSALRPLLSGAAVRSRRRAGSTLLSPSRPPLLWASAEGSKARQAAPPAPLTEERPRPALPALAASLASFLSLLLGQRRGAGALLAEEDAAAALTDHSEKLYQWRHLDFDSEVSTFGTLIGNTLGSIFGGLSSAALGAVWDLFTSDDKLLINRTMEELDNVGLQISKKPESEYFRKLYAIKSRECAEVLLPRIHGMLQNQADSSGRKLSEHHADQLRILKCKLQSSLHSISMDMVRGHADLKQDLEECVVWPCLNGRLFKDIRRPPRGILLYGPPGNGKTMIAKALASRVGVPFYQISSCDVVSKYHGDSEKNIRAVCEAARAEPHGAVVFVDEIDSLAPDRDGFGIHGCEVKQINELLHQIDGIKLDSDYDKVIYIAATNRPWSLDPALLRRLPKKCYLGPPDPERRRDFMQFAIEDNAVVGFQLAPDELSQFVALTQGYSYSAMDSLVREACMQPVREVVERGCPVMDVRPGDVPPVTLAHLRRAATKIHADVRQSDLARFDNWAAEPTAKGAEAQVQQAQASPEASAALSAAASALASVQAMKNLSEEELAAECARLHAQNVSLHAELSAKAAPTAECARLRAENAHLHRELCAAKGSRHWAEVVKVEAMRMAPMVAVAWVLAKTVHS